MAISTFSHSHIHAAGFLAINDSAIKAMENAFDCIADIELKPMDLFQGFS